MKITLDPANGTALASDADEGLQNPVVAPTAQNPAGTAASPAVSTWSFQNADQLGKFMRGSDQAEHPLRKAPKGDVSAALDMANEFAKQAKS